MAVCSGLTEFINLDPDCSATRRTGGANKAMYVGSLADVDSVTKSTDGEVTAITMKTGKKLFKISGKKYKNSGSYDLQKSENSTQFAHTVVFAAYYNTQIEKNAIERLAMADDLFFILQTNFGRTECYGLVGDNNAPASGLEMTAAPGGTGTVAEDASNSILTFTGSEAKMPAYGKFGIDLSAELEVLEGLMVVAA
jgi:hypothetical protein